MAILNTVTVADPGFQVRGGALKKIALSGERREKFGVFRVKNHDFTPKNHIFFNTVSVSRYSRPIAVTRDPD